MANDFFTTVGTGDFRIKIGDGIDATTITIRRATRKGKPAKGVVVRGKGPNKILVTPIDSQDNE